MFKKYAPTSIAAEAKAKAQVETQAKEAKAKAEHINQESVSFYETNDEQKSLSFNSKTDMKKSDTIQGYGYTQGSSIVAAATKSKSSHEDLTLN
jgi:hypothetical protein